MPGAPRQVGNRCIADVGYAERVTVSVGMDTGFAGHGASFRREV